jgi:outer membrane protein OmpA-like peptidoglycan-associated protein
MPNPVRTFVLALACVIVAGGVLAALTPSLRAQSLQDQILEGLTKRKVIAPSQPDDPKVKEQQEFIEGLRKRMILIEPVNAADRAKMATIAKGKPAVDLEIYFDYNSAVVGPQAQKTLAALGNVLGKPELKGTVFFINGHTDARGSDEYNQQLSARRAAAVRRALIDQFKLQPDTLIAAGFGKEQLKLPDQPFAAKNRRVEVVNTEQK